MDECRNAVVVSKFSAIVGIPLLSEESPQVHFRQGRLILLLLLWDSSTGINLRKTMIGLTMINSRIYTQFSSRVLRLLVQYVKLGLGLSLH